MKKKADGVLRRFTDNIITIVELLYGGRAQRWGDAVTGRNIVEGLCNELKTSVDHEARYTRKRETIKKATHTLLQNFDGIFDFRYMIISADNIDMDRGQIRDHTFEFIVTLQFMYCKTTAGVDVDGLID